MSQAGTPVPPTQVKTRVHLDTGTVVASAVPSRWARCTELAGDSQRYNALGQHACVVLAVSAKRWIGRNRITDTHLRQPTLHPPHFSATNRFGIRRAAIWFSWWRKRDARATLFLFRSSK